LKASCFMVKVLLTNRWRQVVTCNKKYYTSATQVALINSRAAGNLAWTPSNLQCDRHCDPMLMRLKLLFIYGTPVQQWIGSWCYNQIILFIFWISNLLNYAIWNSGMRGLCATN
jgi:hypothetical protein